MIVLIVGRPGSGKTTFIKKKIKGLPKNSILAIDFNYEYPNAVQFFFHDELIQFALNCKNKVVIFDEATAYFGSQNSLAAKQLFARHRHLNHHIFVVFHSLRSIPPDILPFANFFLYLGTNEKLPLPAPFDFVFENQEKFLRKVLPTKALFEH